MHSDLIPLALSPELAAAAIVILTGVVAGLLGDRLLRPRNRPVPVPVPVPVRTDRRRRR